MSPALSIALTVVCVLGIGAGQIFFRKGALAIDGGHWISSSLANPSLWVALVIYAAATALWIYVLRFAPLNRVYPVFALAFVFVPFLEWLILGEPFRMQTLAGGALIFLGVAIAVR